MVDNSKKLKKELSLFGVYTLATGATLSSGFFLLPGLAATEAGSAVFLSYLIAVIPLMPGMLSKLELATAMPRAGGEYYFLDRSLGPFFGTISGLGTWCGLVLKTAFALVGIGAYLKYFFPDLPMTPLVTAVALFFGTLNLFGAHKSTKLQTVLVLALEVLLVLFFFKGVPSANLDHFTGMLDQGWYAIIATSGMVCVSFMGLTNAASVAEEVKDPERNLSLGILLAIATSIVVYGVGTFVLVGAVPPEKLAGSLTPVADAAAVMSGRTGAVIMTVAAILAFLSVGNAGIMSASRYPLAMSRDHLLPRWFRKLNSHQAPQSGIIVTTAVILLFVTVLDPTKIAKLASTFLLMLFALNCLAVIVMRESQIESYDPGYRSPWYPWMQLFGIVGPIALIIVMGWLPMLFAGGVIAVGSAWYFYYAKKRVRRGGAIYHLFARLGQQRFEGLDRELRSILKEKGLRAADPYDEIVARSDVIDGLEADSFDDLVRKASVSLSTHLPVESDQLFDRFMEGTRVGATPVSKGVALPHMRLAGLDKPLMVLGRSRAGVRIEIEVDFIEHIADDGIHAVIFLVSSEENAARHLRVLAQIAQQVDRDQFIEDWLDADNHQRLREILLRNERYLVIDLQPGEPHSAMIGQAVKELELPDETLIAMINRNGQVIFPRGDTTLKEGDRLTMVGAEKSIDHLRRAALPQ
jgi:amino acid transporter/mannitol/fructose-specific phosphotransferase system IIA component (Ntr-type)